MFARFRSFHGGYYGIGAVMGDVRRMSNEPGAPGGIRVWDPFCYRCFFKMKYPECDLYCAESLRELIEVEGPETIAGIIVEPRIRSCGKKSRCGFASRQDQYIGDYGKFFEAPR